MKTKLQLTIDRNNAPILLEALMVASRWYKNPRIGMPLRDREAKADVICTLIDDIGFQIAEWEEFQAQKGE